MPKPDRIISFEGIADQYAEGKALRKRVPRSSHGEWASSADRPNPIALLQRQDAGRLEYLLPIKYGRMMASPFAFLRGSAVVMAGDLAATPTTGFNVALCGDAHLYNFGLFATPERNVVFDINDFDETYIGPWEWDVKRLAASAVVAGRTNGFDDETCTKLAVLVGRSYRKAMRRAANMSVLAVWYFQVNATTVVDLFNKVAGENVRQAAKTLEKARRHTTLHTLEKLTHIVDGRGEIINNPPLVVRLSELMTDEEKEASRQQGDIEKIWQEYLQSLPEERRVLLRRFRITDAALRVGGVGSVGTRCMITLLESDRPEDAMILQQKEAGASALAAYLPRHPFANEAERVVVGQRLMQASSDIFLGWMKSAGRDYYWRQLKDMKGSFDVTAFDPAGVGTYLAVCAATLARAHARSGDAAKISGYLGSSTTWDDAIGRFAVVYADQTNLDHQALVNAITSGQIMAQPGV